MYSLNLMEIFEDDYDHLDCLNTCFSNIHYDANKLIHKCNFKKMSYKMKSIGWKLNEQKILTYEI